MQASTKVTLSVKTENNFGETPWTDMAFLGYDNLVSGLLHEKYRDNALLFSSVEIEQQLNGLSNIDLSKHSLLLGFGGGTIYGSNQGPTQPLFEFKFGYRYEYQPGFKMSINLGITGESTGIFLNFHKRIL
jgi:hypothetical protein